MCGVNVWGIMGRSSYIEQRRRRWYFVLDVPQDVRHVVNKSRIVQSLQTESKTVAERSKGALLDHWKTNFARIRSGEAPIPETLTDVLSQYRDDFSRAKGEDRVTLLGVLEETSEDLSRKYKVRSDDIRDSILGINFNVTARLAPPA